MKKIQHHLLFFSSVRSAILFLGGFILYEILLDLEKIWNKENPENIAVNYYKRNSYKFLGILIIDLMILYFLFFLTGNYY